MTGRINGRFEVCLLRKRFKSWRIFSLITPQSVFSSCVDCSMVRTVICRACSMISCAFLGWQEAARHNFGRDSMCPVCLSMAMIGTTYAVFGQMAPVANHYFFDLFERARIDQHAARGHRLAAECTAVRGEFDRLPAFQQENFATNGSELFGQRGVLKKLPVFAVHWHEILRLNELQKDLHLLLAGMPRNVNRRRPAAFVIHQHAPAEEMIDHPEDCFSFPGIMRDERITVSLSAMLISRWLSTAMRDMRGHRLGLRPARQHDQLLADRSCECPAGGPCCRRESEACPESCAISRLSTMLRPTNADFAAYRPQRCRLPVECDEPSWKSTKRPLLPAPRGTVLRAARPPLFQTA